MDEMKIGSNLMKKLIAKLIKMAVKNKLGYEVDIQLSELHATIIDGQAHIHLNADAEISKDELIKIIKKTGL